MQKCIGDDFFFKDGFRRKLKIEVSEVITDIERGKGCG